MKKRRLELSLLQREVAKELRISDASYFNWENDQKMPRITLMGRVIEWLGYDPHPEPTTAGEEIIAMRRRRGISRKKLAREIGIDESTLRKIEESRLVLRGDVIKHIKRSLSGRYV